MVIEDSDYRLTPVGDDCPLWDLQLIKVVNKGKKNERTELGDPSYGLPLDHAIRRIVHNRICRKCGEDTITLKMYINEYRQINDELKKLLQ